MKILIVTEYFPPENAIASLRLYSFAKYWHRAGHTITVLTAEKTKSEKDLHFDCSFARVIRLPIPFFTKPAPSAQAGMPQQKPKQKSIMRKIFFPFLKKAYFSFNKKTGCFSSHFPHFCDLWAKKAVKLVENECFDVVVSSAGPYSVHRVGLALKKKNPAIQWIADWRDLWVKDIDNRGFIVFRPYETYLERKFNASADFVTTVSEPIAGIFQKTTKTRVITIYNGFDSDDYRHISLLPRKKNKPFTLVWTGSLNLKMQNPVPLFQALSNIKKKYNVTPDKITLQFAGPQHTDISHIAKKYDVAELYNYLGFIPRENALQMQYDADAVLFFDFVIPNNLGLLTGKIFEYLYIAREIIAIGIDENTSAGDLIKKTNSGVYLGSEIDTIERFLLSRINGEKPALQKNDDLIHEFTRENQADKLLNYISKG